MEYQLFADDECTGDQDDRPPWHLLRRWRPPGTEEGDAEAERCHSSTQERYQNRPLPGG
jgi:hypothetical protein